MSKIILSAVFLIFASTAEATKCLKAKNLDELKKDFPIIISGKIVSKEPLNKNLDTFKVRVKVVKYISGNSKKQFFEGLVMEPSKVLASFPPYEINREYIFPIQKTKKGELEIVVPALGCPAYLEK